ncbi:hypothetical protein [Marivirga sp.]|uniref:hypothetical protein n=1 Tax=Marivirga sp. TaxID=2018662 RepID=UPI0025F3CE77|nr:hypothetical protein [Marivirga sp.]
MTINLEELRKKESKERLAKRKLRKKQILERWEPVMINLKKIELFYSELNNHSLQEFQMLVQSLESDFNSYKNSIDFSAFSENVEHSESILASERSFKKLKEEVIKAGLANEYFREKDMVLCREIRGFFNDCKEDDDYLTPVLFSFDVYSPINESDQLKNLIYLIKLNSNLDIILRAVDILSSHCIDVYKSPHYMPPKPGRPSLLSHSNDDEEATVMRSFQDGEQDRFGY